MLRKATLLCILYYTLALIVSGCKTCDPWPVQTFRWSKLSLNNFSYTYKPDSTLNVILDADTNFSNKTYMLGLTTDYEVLALNNHRGSSLFNEAYACDPGPPPFNIPNPIVGVHIHTVNNYDNAHSAGTEITDCFGSPTWNGRAWVPGPLDPKIGRWYAGGQVTTDYEYYMAKRPEPGSKQQFKVIVTLQDSTSFTELTPELQF